MRGEPLHTVEELRARLSYCPVSGEFHWRNVPANEWRAGMLACYPHKQIGRVVHVDGETYAAHRLAVVLQTGEWPKARVLHRNGNKGDNAWKNLTESTTTWLMDPKRKAARAAKAEALRKKREADKALAKAMAHARTERDLVAAVNGAKLFGDAREIAKAELALAAHRGPKALAKVSARIKAQQAKAEAKARPKRKLGAKLDSTDAGKRRRASAAARLEAKRLAAKAEREARDAAAKAEGQRRRAIAMERALAKRAKRLAA